MFFCFIVLLFSVPLQAQTEEDSTQMIIEGVKEDIADEEEQDDSGDNEYFLKKWEYARDSLSIQQRKLSDSLIKKMQADKNFWYANEEFEKEKKKEQQKKNAAYVPLGRRSWFQTLMWFLIIGGFAAFLIIYLSGSNIGLFRKKNFINNEGEEEEGITEDIFAINYQKEIDKAAMQGNYRLAVRLMYLRLLKNMSEKNIIQYKQDKTNLDYLMQLHPTKHYTNFFRVTRNYEYSWYGKFDVSEQSYRLICREFDQFDNELR
jgi:hypothetical protein